MPNPIHAGIAGSLSTARATAARVSNDPASQGIITRGKRCLRMLGIERLEDLVKEVETEQRR